MKLDPILDKYRWKSGLPVVIAVSGWPDSMCVMSLLVDHYKQQSRDLSTLHIAHYHHRQRTSSDDERDLVISSFDDCTIHIWYYAWSSSTERDLRIARHQFFRSVMESVGSTVLVIWHNLTDRIETSLINMTRWCQIKWLLNMSMIDTKVNFIHYPKLLKQSTLRPLLWYAKSTIHGHCDKHQIPYMIDESNQDISVSQRNQIRKDIVMKLSDQQLHNRQAMYERIEHSKALYDDPSRDETAWWYALWAIWEWSLEYLARVFDRSWCYADMTSGRLLERQQWITTSYQWEKYVWWWKWWIKKKKVFILKHKQ